MDYILFNSDGSIKQRKLTDFIQKGNDGVNSIFVSVEGIDDLDSYTCSVNFELPNGDLTIATPTQVTDLDQITIDGVDYIGWLVPIDAQVTVYEGIVKFSLIITDIVSNPNKVLLTFNAKLVINPSVVSPNDTTITVAQYNELLTVLNSKANISNTIIIIDNILADISGYNEGQIFFDKQFRSYWIKGSNNSLQGFDVKLERAVTLTGTETIANLVLPDLDIANWGIGKYNDDLLFVKLLITTTPTPNIEYTIYQLSKNGEIKCWHNDNATGSETIAQILATTPTNEYATKGYVDSVFSKLKVNSFQVVESLPTTGQGGIIYLIETSSGIYEQYIWEGNDYIDLGSTQIDLSDYVKKTQTIAGIDLQDDITSQELTDALVFATNSDIDALFN